jgi:formyltetrahydrofolate deformylase
MSHELLLIDCRDEPGLINKITGIVFHHGLNIVRNQEFVDDETGRFFMRTELVGDPAGPELAAELVRVLPPDARLRVAPMGNRRVVVLVTKEHHCVGELLLRHAFGELGAEILAVVGNHPTLAGLVERFDVPFHYVPHAGVSRPEHEARIAGAVALHDPEYLILAKYMRILSADFVRRYPQRIINIHHSFLPAFAGAQPYRQAFERGVKVIGATAHFVTEVLDEGPIISQSVIPVDHSYTPATMARAGRDVEKVVLADALRLVFEERVFLVGNRTIVFD